MKFLDSNVVIYAFFVPKRQLKPDETKLKEKSRKILQKIDEGEQVAISVVNLSEIANVLKNCFSPLDLADLLETFHTKENITILDVTKDQYLAAIAMSKDFGGKVNDCLGAFLMRTLKIKEIYTFDDDFKAFPWVQIKHEP